MRQSRFVKSSNSWQTYICMFGGHVWEKIFGILLVRIFDAPLVWLAWLGPGLQDKTRFIVLWRCDGNQPEPRSLREIPHNVITTN